MAESNHKNRLPVSKSFWHIFDTTAVTLDVMVTWFFLSPPPPKFLLLLKCLSSGSPNWWQREAKVRWDLGQPPGRDNVSSVYAWKLTEQYLTVSFLFYRNVRRSFFLPQEEKKEKKKAIVCCSCYFLSFLHLSTYIKFFWSQMTFASITFNFIAANNFCITHFSFFCVSKDLFNLNFSPFR